jgi:hypothetical protein
MAPAASSSGKNLMSSSSAHGNKKLPINVQLDNIRTLTSQENNRIWSASITSAKTISILAEWLHQCGHAPSEPSELPRWRITLHAASIAHVALHITLRSPFLHFFSLCQSPNSNENCFIVANCDHMSEWVHCIRAAIGIVMRWVM